MPGYNPSAIEKKWQQRWAEGRVFATDARDHSKPKFYVLDMFPYPSGQGLHVGHPEGYTATDIVARYKRAKGFNVMHPMGWDAFGLPAEQYAIKNNVHPRETTANNIDRFRKQLQSLGFSYDWEREVDTTDPGYYKWTQWIFLKLYDTWFDEKEQRGRPIKELIDIMQRRPRMLGIDLYHAGAGPGDSEKKWDDLTPTQQRRVLTHYRLAYEAEVPVNWCPGLGTVLANEEVIDGKSEVGGFPVERKPMKQWMLRITAYAERLIAGLEKLEWSESLKEMQRNWIGKSEGAEVRFEIETRNAKRETRNDEDVLTVFTTRPDTLFGATYMVVAPEHPIVGRITTADRMEKVKAYRAWAASRSDRERQEDTGKTGEFTGAHAINPVNGEEIPIWISDYVLMGYGTGAIMAVPAHDGRDFEFAKKFKIPMRAVIVPTKDSWWLEREGDGPVPLPYEKLVERYLDAPELHIEAFASIAMESIVTRSENGEISLNGLSIAVAKSRMTDWLESKGIGKRKVQYKLRDWLFSRQRYWGEPFPLVHLEDGTTVALAESELPVRLPELADFKPTGTIDPPLSKAKDWLDVWVVLEKRKAKSEKRNAGDVVARVKRLRNRSMDGTLTAPIRMLQELWVRMWAWMVGAVKARRELNTMPQWAGSCWYYIRYLDAKNAGAFVDGGVEKYWLGNGVDLYVGGVEHAVLHLLYARFWHKVLFDWGLVSCEEPFRRLVNQGLILGEMEYLAFKTEEGKYVSVQSVDPNWDTRVADSKIQTISKQFGSGSLVVGVPVGESEVEKKGEGFVLRNDPTIRVDARTFKMSKARGNVVNPDDVVKEYGADSLRLFEMFMGPLEQVKPWSTAGVEGVYRFLQRVWRNIFDENDNTQKYLFQGEGDDGLGRPLHRLIKKVTDDIERLSFNTAIAAMMDFNNQMTAAKAKADGIEYSTVNQFIRLLEPFAPHFAEEVFERLGTRNAMDLVSVSQLEWPKYEPAMLVDSSIEIPIQVNGKLRGRITVAADADEATVIAASLGDAEVQKALGGKELKKKIYVKGRMVNLVV